MSKIAFKSIISKIGFYFIELAKRCKLCHPGPWNNNLSLWNISCKCSKCIFFKWKPDTHKTLVWSPIVVKEVGDYYLECVMHTQKIVEWGTTVGLFFVSRNRKATHFLPGHSPTHQSQSQSCGSHHLESSHK